MKRLIELGWNAKQIVAPPKDPEWRVPKTPSEATKREKGNSFSGFPVDIAVFRDVEEVGEWESVQIIIETKQPEESAGVSQLMSYMQMEPKAVLGIWTNGSQYKGVYRTQTGDLEKRTLQDLPGPDDNLLLAGDKRLKWEDLQEVAPEKLGKTFEQLLDHIVSTDNTSTRRDEQLNQLCNLILIKLESDRKAQSRPSTPVLFQVWGDEEETATRVREYYGNLRTTTHTDLFSSSVDETLLLDDETIHRVCYELARVKLLESSPEVVALAFQVFRTASLKSEEGQYFTPYPVLRSAVRLMEIDYDDKIIDPACGTGGFLIECINRFQEENEEMPENAVRSWSQTHVYGVDKDKINVKLTKAMMMIMGDGHAHIYAGDSLRSSAWGTKFPHLSNPLRDGTFSVVLTNPPFGRDLNINAKDAKASDFSIARRPKKDKEGKVTFDTGKHRKIPMGIAFIERAHRLLMSGGRLGIILPETYLFSSSYLWLQDWLDAHFILRGAFNVPMEAFQKFARAKTNFYVFEKI